VNESKTAAHLIDDACTLIDATDELRKVLLRYKRRITELVAVTRAGRGSMIEAVEEFRGGVLREEVTSSMEAFEEARRRVRVAMFARALEQGASISEMGRAIGISRQLASRLAAEVKHE
jgi:hypothetical protein